jgi:preprotein translocase subunit SecD
MASETPQPGFERREQLMGGIPAYISPVDVLSDDMVRHVTVKPIDDGLVLHVRFSEEGRRRLETATRERLTSHMAILLDSHLVAFAPIQSTLSRGDIDIGLKLPGDKLEFYQAKIAERWPPTRVRSPQ